jgi:hypothetical protein
MVANCPHPRLVLRSGFGRGARCLPTGAASDTHHPDRRRHWRSGSVRRHDDGAIGRSHTPTRNGRRQREWIVRRGRESNPPDHRGWHPPHRCGCGGSWVFGRRHHGERRPPELAPGTGPGHRRLAVHRRYAQQLRSKDRTRWSDLDRRGQWPTRLFRRWRPGDHSAAELSRRRRGRLRPVDLRRRHGQSPHPKD